MFSDADGMTSGVAGERYRRDIDGLRALAIVPVLLFHLKIGGFSGGLVGVDVFFVISGFLITRGLIDRQVSDARGLLDFYRRRARRVLPALAAMLAATLIAGWFILMPLEYEQLGTRVFANAAFASNFLFWLKSDYFANADLDPLLHSWSLAVEEQFYLLFPLLLILLRRLWPRRSPFWPIMLITLPSFGLSVWLLANGDQATAFYLLPPRAWELLLGALLACDRLPPAHNRLVAELLAVLGIAMIVATILLLGENDLFPGLNALWPCLGAVAVLHANGVRSTAIGRLLSLPPLRAIGMISYSLYLIHWPVIVFTEYALARSLAPGEKTILLVAMMGSAALSWRFVEQPFRRPGPLPARGFALAAGAILLWLGAAGLTIQLRHGIPHHRGFSDIKHLMTATQDLAAPGRPMCFLSYPEARWDGAKCLLSHGRGPNILLWGDSHAAQYRQAIEQAAPALDLNLLLFSSTSCVPIPGVEVYGSPDCHPRIDMALSAIDRFKVRTIILSAHWQQKFEWGEFDFPQLAAVVRRWRAAGLRVKIIGDNPSFDDWPRYLAYRLDRQGVKTFAMPSRNDPSINARLRALVGDADFFDPGDALCHGGRCLFYANGHPIVYDAHHLTTYGAGLVLTRLRRFLAN